MNNSVLLEALFEWLDLHLLLVAGSIVKIREDSFSVVVIFDDDTWIRISKNQLETKEVSS